jgi:hypothetical protein
MPPLILILAGLVGGAALVRLAAKEGRRINRELDEARRVPPDERETMPKLRRDPKTGSFRPQ